ncbi:DEAD/DEAH box helicase [Carbonactinospora thermoautotrophica]|uniref:DEAD/DEAH box helicase n=1 Tax=Carbonactinospora thermoautotrophica TaxID=1469144 RepID=UPI002271022C|nr:DEAD/DEAH box helicase [Carbonactinospora thermoautotrophica]
MAPIDYVRSLLGEHVCALLDLIEGGSAAEERIRDVAAAVVDPERLLDDPDARDRFLSLLSDAKQRELVSRLGGDLSVAPATALRNLDWTPNQRRLLLGFLGLIVDRAPDEPIPARRDCAAAYGLFPHQRRAAERIQALIYSGERRAVLHLPTGVGKTRTAMHIIADHLRRYEPTLVVWLAHGQELLEQAASEFERAWGSLGNRPVTIARMWGDSSVDLVGVSDGLVVLGIEKAVSAAKANRRFLDELGARTTLTVFDEAHQAIAPTYRRVIDSLTLRRDSSLLGLTATPGRTWADICADERLAEFFAHQKVMLEIDGYSNPVTALIDQGYLAKPTFRTVAAKSGMRLSDADRRSLADSFDLPEHLLARLASDVQWNLQVIRTVMDLVTTHQRILVFAASVAHCRLLSAMISALGIECDYVTGETTKRRRDRAIARFKGPTPRPMVLCNYGVLTTGFDAPAASAAVIARPTRSLVLYSQMVGRVIRGPKAGGTPTCEVVTVVDPTLPGFGDVAEAFTNWEDVWEIR